MPEENGASAASAATVQAEAKENEVLSMFFDDEFVPHAFLDALFSSSLNVKPSMTNNNVNGLGNSNASNNTGGLNSRQHVVQQKEFASQASLKALQNKNSSLLNHLDYYTNELTRQFEQKLNNLQNASSVISYSSGASGNDSNNNNSSSSSSNANNVVGITRLEYYIENLSSSVNSLYRDLNEINGKINEIQNGKKPSNNYNKNDDDDDDENKDKEEQKSSTIRDLNDLLLIKNRLQSVIDVFELAKAIVTTSSTTGSEFGLTNVQLANTTSDLQQDENKSISISIETFQSSLNIFEETILEELRKDRTGTKEGNSNVESLLQKCDSLMDLLPLFKNMRNFYPIYLKFVQFLDSEKKRFLSR